jgi:phospholipase/carboxylesterase
MADILSGHFENLRLKYRLAKTGIHADTLFMMHGWGGDEDSMWVFSSKVPETFSIIALRGLYPVQRGGFQWSLDDDSEWNSIQEFKPAISSLHNLAKSGPFNLTRQSRLHLLGFSQGAALCYAFAAQYPHWVASIGGLAGFLPGGMEDIQMGTALQGVKFFISHGSADDVVPIERARQAVDFFINAKADVTFCESASGHKLDVNCYKALGKFYKRLAQANLQR